MKNPELVLPAGDLEKLKTAILFGADAVYLGGKEYSLRAHAGNFTLEEMSEGVSFTHQRGKKLYVAVNILAHNHDLSDLPVYLEELEKMQVDGIIVSDPGVMRLAGRFCPHIPITVSTQANVTNYEAAAFYRDLGASRIVLARELSLKEIEEVKNQVDVEVEVFIHGAMCVSYSGRCLLSHYMTGRSANLGACAHPCRYNYALVEEKRPGQYYPIEEDQRGSYILNSRDLCLIEYVPDLMEIGVEAFKVEGRMKSPLYIASVTKTYRQAIDVYARTKEPFSRQELEQWILELEGTATRPFTNGFVQGESPIIQDINKEKMAHRLEFCGVVKGYDYDRETVEVEQRANFGIGDDLEFLTPSGEIINLELVDFYDEESNLIERARHPRQRVFIPLKTGVPEYSILRRVTSDKQG